MDHLLAIGLDMVWRVEGAVALLLFVISVELIWPRQSYSVQARLKGAAFYLVGAAAAALIFDLLGDLWVATGVRPIAQLRFGEWFGWAGPFGVPIAAILAMLMQDFFGYWYRTW